MKPTKAQIKKAKNLLNKYAPKGEELAYINSKEANLLKKMGGTGEDVNSTGIKSYRRTSSGMDMSGSGRGVSNHGDYSSQDNEEQQARDTAAYNSGQKSKAQENMDWTEANVDIKRRDAGPIKFQGSAAVWIAQKVGRTISDYNKMTQGRSAKNDPYGLYAEGNFKQKSRVDTTYQSDNDNRQLSATNVGGKIIKSPTTAEVSQSSATDVTYDSRKTKAKGRKMTILTSAKGLGKYDELILGKKSLLGRA